MELEIHLKTNKFLGNNSFANELFNLLVNNTLLTPQKLGNFEPLKNSFKNDFNYFMTYWKNPNGNIVLWKGGKHKNNYGICEYGKSKDLPYFNTLSFSFQFIDIDEAENYLNDILFLFDSNKFIFGRIGLKEEYDQYNILKNTNFFYNKKGEKVIMSDGSSCPILAVGTNIQKHLPGLYWKTIFGKEYVDFIGKDKFIKANPYQISELLNGSVILQAYDKPESFNNELTLKEIKRLKDCLGEKLFIEKNNLERNTIAPTINVSEIMI